MVVQNNFFNNGIGRVGNSSTVRDSRQPVRNSGEFGRILQEKVGQENEVKFSKHAEFRLQSRNIKLTQAQKDKINEAVKKAEDKGVKESLVLMDDIALVVNVKNRTVVTAVNSSELKDNVFTNIDGAVFV